MLMPLISVIIPVYNAEKFLDECVASVLGQDYPALEIILVDDGSPDACPGMCDRYAAEHDRVKTVHQANRGAGLARNAGMEAASGEYIAFVDSDDLLDGEDAISRMAVKALGSGADIVAASFRWFEGGSFGDVRRHGCYDGMDTDSIDFCFKGIGNTVLVSASYKLYRREFLDRNGILFAGYAFGEDRLFNMMCCACRPTYAFLEESVYVYRVNMDSVTHNGHDGFYVHDWISVAADLDAFLSDHRIDGYGCLTAFHLCMGLPYLAGHKLRDDGWIEAVRTLAVYGQGPLVRRMALEIAGGKYIHGLSSHWRRMKLWVVSVLCSFRLYVLIVLLTWLTGLGGNRRAR